MKKNSILIITLLDRSGSMSSIRDDMIGGFNTYLANQRKLPGECRVSLFQFDDIFEMVHENVDINKFPDLTKETFVPRGCTALLDSVSKAIKKVGDQLEKTPEDQRPEKVLVVIITDGLENASREFTAEQVRNMITHQTQVYSWDFVYIGANQDAWDVASSMGISMNAATNYVASAAGTANMFQSLNAGTVSYRSACAGTKYSFGNANQPTAAPDPNKKVV